MFNFIFEQIKAFFHEALICTCVLYNSPWTEMFYVCALLYVLVGI